MHRTFALAAPLLVAAAASAQGVPPKLAYQGRLLKSDGTPETGVIDFTFNLYVAATGGNSLWTELQRVPLTDGFYALVLGDVTPLPPSAFTDGAEKFLEIWASGYVLTPRLRLTSVPYALVAGSTTSLTAGKVTLDSGGLAVNGARVVDGATGLVATSALDLAAVQARVAGGCAPNGAIADILPDGGVTCAPIAPAGQFVQNGTSPQAASFAVTGSGVVGGGLAVTGAFSVAGSSAVSGDATLAGSSAVSGDETIGGGLTVGGGPAASAPSALALTKSGGANYLDLRDSSHEVVRGVDSSVNGPLTGEAILSVLSNNGLDLRTGQNAPGRFLIDAGGLVTLGSAYGGVWGPRVPLRSAFEVHGNGAQGLSVTNDHSVSVDGADVSGNPRVELRGAGLAPYVDFATTSGVDFDARIMLTSATTLTTTVPSAVFSGTVTTAGALSTNAGGNPLNLTTNYRARRTARRTRSPRSRTTRRTTSRCCSSATSRATAARAASRCGTSSPSTAARRWSGTSPPAGASASASTSRRAPRTPRFSTVAATTATPSSVEAATRARATAERSANRDPTARRGG